MLIIFLLNNHIKNELFLFVRGKEVMVSYFFHGEFLSCRLRIARIQKYSRLPVNCSLVHTHTGFINIFQLLCRWVIVILLVDNRRI